MNAVSKTRWLRLLTNLCWSCSLLMATTSTTSRSVIICIVLLILTDYSSLWVNSFWPNDWLYVVLFQDFWPEKSPKTPTFWSLFLLSVWPSMVLCWGKPRPCPYHQCDRHWQWHRNIPPWDGSSCPTFKRGTASMLFYPSEPSHFLHAWNVFCCAYISSQSRCFTAEGDVAHAHCPQMPAAGPHDWLTLYTIWLSCPDVPGSVQCLWSH